MCDDETGAVPPPSSIERAPYKPRFLNKEPPSNQLEGTDSKPRKQLWKTKPPSEAPKILDPDDPLMKRFQDALKAHLTRIDNKLTEEILELESAIKTAENNREDEAVKLYTAQQEIAQQQSALENYQSTLSELLRLREEKEAQVSSAKKLRKDSSQKLRTEKAREEQIIREIESLTSLERQFSEWEKEIASSLVVSRRMSEKDAAVQRDLIRRKQREDYILYKLMTEVWKVESEMKDLDEQLQLKDKEKVATSQTIADANADLDALQREYKNLFKIWNSVIANVGQRDKIYNDLSKERQDIRESFQTLQSGIEKLRRETSKEMEDNERLTSLQSRIEEDIQISVKFNIAEQEKVVNLESQLMKISKLIEQSQAEYNTVNTDYQRYLNDEKLMQKDFEKVAEQKIQLEDQILSTLEERVMHDKAARHLNKILRDLRDVTREQELTVVQIENSYGKTLLEIERLNSIIASDKLILEELIRNNVAKEKEIDQTQTEIKRCELLIGKRQRQLDILNKKIEEILAKTGGEEVNPLDSKILILEKNIEETEQKNQKSQKFWLRQEGYMVNLSQQRRDQMQEISLLNKQITIMEQKNLKLEYELERQKKEEVNMNRTVNAFQQKLLQLNGRLAMQKGIKDTLEDQNCLTKSEYVRSLEEAEMGIIKLQSDIEQLEDERVILKEQLNEAQRESLSWEKKVQLAYETTKSVRSENSAGGDVAVMKSEIHKMQMRLSHLRKAQEKLIQDMEHCVSRRDAIVDGARAKEKKNPRGQHNQRIVFQKRLDDQRIKIKQIMKETKQMETEISELEVQQKEMLERLNEGERQLKSIEDVIPAIDQQMVEAELIKQHNLETLIRKQHKVKMFQDVRDGRHRLLYKSEEGLNDELQRQRIMNMDLKEVMEQTQNDFPLLKNHVRKILLTLQTP